VDIPLVRENTYSVGVYLNDPDGNELEVYYEEPGGCRGAWEGQHARKLSVSG
jgi:catechol-2,3-dioxygenase